MIKLLEDLLYQKTLGQPSEILYAQWNFDKVLIPQALQSISNIFPHYSLHDESHSITIVSNIVRILGRDAITSLSAADIWLILEAAYSHDLGMVPSGERLALTFESANFIDFFGEIVRNPGDPLSMHASAFKIINGKLEWKESQVRYQQMDSMRFLLAEYFRRKHADISEEIVNDPYGQISLGTPRVVVPQRIWRLLGRICSAHMKDFGEVMDLSYSEVGMDLEYAHPRFVACMLRLGDLLDLDNNRFSDVMLRTLSTVPTATLVHKEKHLSIDTLRVDTELIDIVAKCSDYESADATQHWFAYLDTEINDQTRNWKKIAPPTLSGSLPIIERLAVELKDYEYIDGRNRPQFSVDTNKTIELLKGAGIYSDKYEALREIIQNSIDATLICLWEEFGEKLVSAAPNSDLFQQLAKNKSITIKISSLGTENKKQKWQISIQDNGIGISMDDLRYLCKTGSSAKNRTRTNTIQRMPKWLQPSGVFGIGFQSIFLLTDKVTVTTKSIYTGEYREIHMHSVDSSKHGAIYVKKIPGTFRVKNGTILTFDFYTDVIPATIQVDLKPSFAKSAINRYDYFTYESLDIEVAKLVDSILSFSKVAPIPIELIFKDELITREISGIKKFDWFEDSAGLELNIIPSELKGHLEVDTFYKGQSFENKLSFSFLKLEFNFHQPSAVDILTVNREKVNPNFKRKLRGAILDSTFKIILENFNSLFSTEVDRMSGSLFLHDNIESTGIDLKVIEDYSQWKNVTLDKFVQDTSHLQPATTLGYIYDNVEQIRIEYRSPTESIWENESFEFDANTSTFTFKIVGRPSSHLTNFLLKKLAIKFKYLKSKHSTEEPIIHTYSRCPQELPLEIEDILNFHIKHEPFFGARIMIPCLTKYQNLLLNPEAFIPYSPAALLGPVFRTEYPQMVSPYIYPKSDDGVLLKRSISDKLINWVYDNRAESLTTREQIISTYEIFCHDMDEALTNSTS